MKKKTKRTLESSYIKQNNLPNQPTLFSFLPNILKCFSQRFQRYDLNILLICRTQPKKVKNVLGFNMPSVSNMTESSRKSNFVLMCRGNGGGMVGVRLLCVFIFLIKIRYFQIHFQRIRIYSENSFGQSFSEVFFSKILLQ